ncbi:MAG: two pore domain potassium channel family protein, partial [Actinobacteria bacterium]|nr:two pore domain potassium channel family protein [Actinomycetota bacterium]
LGRLLLTLFGMVVVVLALGVVRATPTYTWLGVLIGLPAVVLTVVDWATGDPAWHLASDLVHVAFYGYTLIGLLRYMFADEVVTPDEIWAIGATFTVAVWLWAYAYSAVQTIAPGSFLAAVDPDAPRTWLELLFLSTTTMTSTGLSDVVPVRPVARAGVMVQQIAGILYLAVAVSRIVGLTLGRRRAQEES